MLGLKYIYFSIDGSTSVGGKIELNGVRDIGWSDPILAVRAKYIPHPRLEIAIYGDSDGNLIGNDLNYQFIGVTNFVVTRWFLISGGYRLWGVKVDEQEALYSGKIRGAIVRLGFQF